MCGFRKLFRSETDTAERDDWECQNSGVFFGAFVNVYKLSFYPL